MLKQIFALVALIGFSSPAVAITPSALDGLFKVNKYKCRVMVLVEDESEFIEEYFEVEGKNGGGHGGNEMTFSKGSQGVTVIANTKWLGLAWYSKGKKIAETISVVTQPNNSSRVLIVMNPNNDEEQVHLNCDLQE